MRWNCVNADCHGYLADFRTVRSVYRTRRCAQRASPGAVATGTRTTRRLELLKGLPCAVSAEYPSATSCFAAVALQVMNQAGVDREGVVQLRTGPGALGVVRGARLHAPPDRQAQGGELGPAHAPGVSMKGGALKGLTARSDPAWSRRRPAHAGACRWHRSDRCARRPGNCMLGAGVKPVSLSW